MVSKKNYRSDFFAVLMLLGLTQGVSAKDGLKDKAANAFNQANAQVSKVTKKPVGFVNDRLKDAAENPATFLVAAALQWGRKAIWNPLSHDKNPSVSYTNDGVSLDTGSVKASVDFDDNSSGLNRFLNASWSASGKVLDALEVFGYYSAMRYLQTGSSASSESADKASSDTPKASK